jgi:hypothetical protein
MRDLGHSYPVLLRGSALALILFVLKSPLLGVSYYLDTSNGNNANTGLSPDQAWASLERASAENFLAGTSILLKSGEVFEGSLSLTGQSGSEAEPIRIAAYGDGARPVIDAKGFLAGIYLEDCHHVEIAGIEITADGGVTVDGSSASQRYGVYVKTTWNGASSDIHLRDLFIHHIFPEVATSNEGANPTSYLGTAIFMQGAGGGNSSFPIEGILIENCRIERTGHMAIRFQRSNDIQILNNTMLDIGGPAIQPSRCNDILVQGNLVNRSGSLIDPRMHGRGSGIWPWFSHRVVIQHNTFMNARGREDSCGMHIDFLCRDVLVQYNLSVGNAGGFIEILGDNYNCTYRYNVSINDGWRVEGEITQGTLANNADGRVLYLGGWVGSGNNGPNIYRGPFNTYIYNNTIYVRSDITSHFRIHGSAKGALIANNIFHLEGPVSDRISGWRTASGWTQRYTQETIDSIVFENNYYNTAGSLPDHLPFAQNTPIIGGITFVGAGGLEAEDYRVLNADTIADKGIFLQPIEGDSIGIAGGLAMAEDYMGTPVLGSPDLGALEAMTPQHWLVKNNLPESSDVTADPNGDGVSLLLAYALGLDPAANNAQSLPKLQWNAATSTMDLRFYSGAEGVTYLPEVSSNLESWIPVEGDWWVPAETTDESLLRVPTNSEGATPRYLRLVIEAD